VNVGPFIQKYSMWWVPGWNECTCWCCANPALIDMQTLRSIPPKYNGTIGGWILTNQAGVMPYTQLVCDYTPKSPFSIISKSLIERDPAWTLVEGILCDTHDKCYELHHANGKRIRFVLTHGVYIHIASIDTRPCDNTPNEPPRQYLVLMKRFFTLMLSEETMAKVVMHC
jgi:hypothetical protein